jgi:hypothetical protein
MGELQCIMVDGDVDAPGWIAADRDGAGKSHALGDPVASHDSNCSLRAGAKRI